MEPRREFGKKPRSIATRKAVKKAAARKLKAQKAKKAKLTKSLVNYC